MEPEGEVEVEGGEQGIEDLMGVLVAPVPVGIDLEVSLAHTLAVTDTSQVYSPCMDLMVQTGGAKM